MSRLRISSISFLNTAPLMWDFRGPRPPRDFRVTYTVPSACAEAVRTSEADIGLIPVAAYAAIPGLRVVPGVSIAAKGAVRSILLVSKLPLEQVRRVAADTSSRTSVALTRVLFRRFWGGPREFIAMEPDLEVMLRVCDAALLIGDSALRIDRSAHRTYDLAEEWRRLTGKPFVFAFWAVREEALKKLRPGLELARVFQESRDHGLEAASLNRIGEEWAPRVGLSPQEVIHYLTENIDYSLDAENLEGLRLFFQHAVEHSVLPAVPELRFLEAAHKVAPARP